MLAWGERQGKHMYVFNGPRQAVKLFYLGAGWWMASPVFPTKGILFLVRPRRSRPQLPWLCLWNIVEPHQVAQWGPKSSHSKSFTRSHHGQVPMPASCIFLIFSVHGDWKRLYSTWERLPIRMVHARPLGTSSVHHCVDLNKLSLLRHIGESGLAFRFSL